MRDRPIERIIVPAALVALLVACDSSSTMVSAPTLLPGVSSLRVSTDTAGLVAGRLHHLRIEARDSGGNQISTDKALAADGRYSEIVATSTIQRMVMNPTLPAPTGSGRECY